MSHVPSDENLAVSPIESRKALEFSGSAVLLWKHGLTRAHVPSLFSLSLSLHWSGTFSKYVMQIDAVLYVYPKHATVPPSSSWCVVLLLVPARGCLASYNVRISALSGCQPLQITSTSLASFWFNVKRVCFIVCT